MDIQSSTSCVLLRTALSVLRAIIRYSSKISRKTQLPEDPEPENPLPHFPQFSRLPKELQDMIWDAVDEPYPYQILFTGGVPILPGISGPAGLTLYSPDLGLTRRRRLSPISAVSYAARELSQRKKRLLFLDIQYLHRKIQRYGQNVFSSEPAFLPLVTAGQQMLEVAIIGRHQPTDRIQQALDLFINKAAFPRLQRIFLILDCVEVKRSLTLDRPIFLDADQLQSFANKLNLREGALSRFFSLHIERADSKYKVLNEAPKVVDVAMMIYYDDIR